MYGRNKARTGCGVLFHTHHLNRVYCKHSAHIEQGKPELLDALKTFKADGDSSQGGHSVCDTHSAQHLGSGQQCVSAEVEASSRYNELLPTHRSGHGQPPGAHGYLSEILRSLFGNLYLRSIRTAFGNV